MVAQYGECIAGFMIYELHNTRIHILNFAVDYAFRRQRVGRQMADKLINRLSEQRRSHISVKVRETNVGAQLFFRSCGFMATSILRDSYELSPEDAILFEYFHNEDWPEAK